QIIPHERNSGNDDSTNIIIFASPSRVVPFSNAIRVPFQMLDTSNGAADYMALVNELVVKDKNR
ncbi:hypothetical protein EEL42_12370, partial [Muribaculaceae bacterium Isolate-100 (HZI)]